MCGLLQRVCVHQDEKRLVGKHESANLKVRYKTWTLFLSEHPRDLSGRSFLNAFVLKAVYLAEKEQRLEQACSHQLLEERGCQLMQALPANAAPCPPAPLPDEEDPAAAGIQSQAELQVRLSGGSTCLQPVWKPPCRSPPAAPPPAPAAALRQQSPTRTAAPQHHPLVRGACPARGPNSGDL